MDSVETQGDTQKGPHRFGPGNPYAFKRGNRAAAGGWLKRRQHRFRQALMACVTVDELRALARSLLKDAMAGDHAAAKLLLAYLCGNPTDDLDLGDDVGANPGPTPEETAGYLFELRMAWRKMIEAETAQEAAIAE